MKERDTECVSTRVGITTYSVYNFSMTTPMSTIFRHPFPMTAPMLPRRHGQLPVRRRLGTVNGGRGRGLRDNGDDGVVAVGAEVAADGLGSVDSWKGEGWSDSQLLAFGDSR